MSRYGSDRNPDRPDYQDRDRHYRNEGYGNRSRASGYGGYRERDRDRDFRGNRFDSHERMHSARKPGRGRGRVRGRGRGRGRSRGQGFNPYNAQPTVDIERFGGDSDNETMTAAEFSLQSISVALPRRPREVVKDGFNTGMWANIHPMSMNIAHITKYDIHFDPPIPEDSQTQRRQAINEVQGQLRELYGHFFDDVTRLWAIRTVHEDREFTWRRGVMTVKFGQQIQVSAITTQYKTQIAGVILQKMLREVGLRRMGRAHYDTARDRRLEISGAQEDMDADHLSLWPGYRCAFEWTVSGMALSVDVQHRLLEDRSVRQFMDQMHAQVLTDCRRGGLSEHEAEEEYKELVRQKLIERHCITMYNNKKWRIDDIDFDADIQTEIPTPDGMMTIKDYFQVHYGQQLKSLHPGLLIHYAKRQHNETENKKVLLPPELCNLTGYGREVREKRNVTTEISTATRIPAKERLKLQNDLIERLYHVAQEYDDILDIPDEGEVAPIQGTILPPFEVYLRSHDGAGGSEDQFIKTGTENLQKDLKKSAFVEKGGPVRYCVVVHEVENSRDADLVREGIMHYAEKGGFANAIDEESVIKERIEVDRRSRNRAQAWRNQLRDILDACPECRSLICVLPNEKSRHKLSGIYGAIKEICSSERGIITQCILARNSKNRHVLDGVIRQLMVKLGNIPWKIRYNLRYDAINLNIPTMMLGLNINHDRTKRMSCCGLAASFDRDFCRYFGNIQYLQLGLEIVEDLGALVRTALRYFEAVNGVQPQQVFVFRDGVSSTQIEEVFTKEIVSIHNALGDDIKLEFIAVQKRVNARFLLQETGYSAPPGTAINDDVVSNQFWDFYLVPARPPPKCVATPTRFIVLRDDLHLNEKTGGEHDLMSLTNQMCSLYYNWPGPTRVPACVKYAAKISQQFCQHVQQKAPHSALSGSYHFL